MASSEAPQRSMRLGMERRLRLGATVAIVGMVVVAAIGGGLLAAARPAPVPPETARLFARARQAARTMEADQAAQQTFGLVSGIVTYLAALDAFGPEVPPELARFAAGVEAIRAASTRDEQVDVLAGLAASLSPTARGLDASSEPLEGAARAALDPPTSETLRGLRAGTARLDPRPYAAALGELQQRVTSGQDDARIARGRLADARLPTAPAGSWSTGLVGATLVLVALVTGTLLVLVVSRQRDLSRRVSTDSLTGTANRRRLDDDVSSARIGPVAVLMVDIDYFKQMNDRVGHAAGDEALRRVAEVIGSCLRDGDTLYRYGGEEFCALLPNASRATAGRVAERIRAAVEAIPVRGEEHLPGERLTVSIGVAEHADAELGIRVADGALYDAKAAGRNRVVMAD